MKLKFSKLILAIMLMVPCVGLADTWTDPVTGITWTYTVANGVASVGGGSSSSTAVPQSTSGTITIPSTLGGYPVTSIGNDAFYNCSGLTSVTISDSVTSIGSSVFRNCSGLTSVTLPARVASIGNYAFSKCGGLTNIAIPNTVTNIGYYAFSECCGLTNFVIPNLVKSINVNTFDKCRGLTNVMIPNSVTNIGAYAFFECSELTNIVIPSSVREIKGYTFYRCRGLTSVEIPNSVTNIEDFAFSGCNEISSVAIPQYVCSKGVLSVFQSYATITNVVISEGVTSVSSSAFSGCLRLASVTIPSSMMIIGNNAFSDCGGLMRVDIEDLSTWCKVSFGNSAANPLTYSHNLYHEGEPVVDLILPEGVTSVNALAFYGCSGLTSVTIPDSVISIGSSAFCGCSGLSSVAIPDGVTSIGSSVFYGCSGLAKLEIPNSVTSIGSSAFSSCSGLKELAIPQTICNSTIASYFPDAYQNITDIIVDDGVTRIANSCFGGCLSLKSVRIPDSVTRLGDTVFSDCSVLKSVVFDGDAPDVGSNIYNGTPRSLVTYVKDGSIGWAGGISSELPEDWNGRGIAVGSPGGGGESGGGESGGGSGTSSSVYLTVTNVVVHYVLNSVVPEIAVPVSGDTGFVTVVTEIKGGAVAIPETWTQNYPDFAEKFGEDFASALTMQTGKRDSQGNPLFVWQDYIAGTDPTDADDVFHASITLVDGEPQISYTPELSEPEAAKRKYTIYGKAKLQDAEWSVVDGDAANYNFFKVTVEMRR